MNKLFDKLFKNDGLTPEILNKRFEIIRTLSAVAIGIILSMIIIFVVSDDPILSIKYLLIGPLLNENNFYGLVVMWIPIVFTGLAICIMFSANQFNLFVEGSFFFGGVVATIIALSVNLPKGIHALVSIVVASIVCALLSAIPAIMKHKLNTSEMVSSIMMNYIFLQLGLFLISFFFRDPNAGSVVSERFPDSARLGELIPRSNIHIGLIVAFVMVIVVYNLMYRTKLGFEIRLIGENQRFAKYTGVSIGAITIISQLLGGALAGAAGAMDVLGLYTRFSWTTLTNHGWDGVTLGILANKNPKYIPIAALFLAYLRKGADLMSMKTGMQTDFVSIIQAVILVFLLASHFLEGYKQKKMEELSRKTEIMGNSNSGGAQIE